MNDVFSMPFAEAGSWGARPGYKDMTNARNCKATTGITYSSSKICRATKAGMAALDLAVFPVETRRVLVLCKRVLREGGPRVRASKWV